MRTLLFALATFCMGYGVAMRHNALPALPPLVLLGFARVLPAQWVVLKRPVRILLAVAFSGAIWLVAQGAGKAIAPENRHQEQIILLHDLAGIYVRTGDLRIPHWAYAGTLDESLLRASYSSEGPVPLFCCDGPRPLRIVARTAEMAALIGVWRDAVLAHPLAYAAHRVDTMRHFLGIDVYPNCYSFHIGISKNALGYEYEPNLAGSFVTQILSVLRNTVIFKGWPYMLIALMLLLLQTMGLRSLHSGISRAVLGSGLASQAVYIVAEGSCDFRFHYWAAMATLLGGYAVLAGFSKHRSHGI
jgi:hypothetical protein